MKLSDKKLLMYRMDSLSWASIEQIFMDEAKDMPGWFINTRQFCLDKWREAEGNIDFVVTETAMEVVDNIKIDVSNFDYTILNKVARQMATIHIGNHQAYRYFTHKDQIHCIQFKEFKDLPHIPYGQSQVIYNGFAIDLKTGDIKMPEQAFAEMKQFTQLMSYIELADTKITVLDSGKKHRVRKEKFINQTSNPFYVVDSAWNKISIRTEGFDVNGHFRWQRCGPGRSEVKLTFVNPYRKHGYIRKAGKEKIK